MLLNRRALLTASVVGVLALGLSACAPASTTSSVPSVGSTHASPQAADVKGELRLYVGGDTNVRDLWEKTIGPKFKQKYPDVTLTIQHDLHSERAQQTLAKLAAANGADPGFDFIDEGLVLDAAKSDLLLPVTKDNVPNLANVPEKNLTEGKGQAFPYRASSVLLAYDPEKVKTPPSTLNEVLDWIKANPGKFAYNAPSTGGSGQAFVVSVLDLFVPADVRERMTTTADIADQKYWDQGFAKLKELGPSMYQQGVYPNGNSQVLDLLISGQIEMAPVWSDQFISGQESGKIPARIKVRQIKDPSFTGGAAFLGIPKGCKNEAVAYALANFVLSPEGQELIVKEMAGYPMISLDKMSDDVKKKFADADPANLRVSYSSDHKKAINAKWDEIVPTKR